MNPIVKRTFRLSAIILLPLSIISAFLWGRKLAMGILIGGILGLVNLRGLARGIEGLMGTSKPKGGKLVFFSLFRLTLLAFILAFLLIYRLVNPFGILIGFTVVFVAIMKEGLRAARESP